MKVYNGWCNKEGQTQGTFERGNSFGTMGGESEATARFRGSGKGSGTGGLWGVVTISKGAIGRDKTWEWE